VPMLVIRNIRGTLDFALTRSILSHPLTFTQADARRSQNLPREGPCRWFHSPKSLSLPFRLGAYQGVDASGSAVLQHQHDNRRTIVHLGEKASYRPSRLDRLDTSKPLATLVA